MELESVLMDIMHKSMLLNCIIINSYLLLILPYRFRHLKESRGIISSENFLFEIKIIIVDVSLG
jgi:hypothetical protein